MEDCVMFVSAIYNSIWLLILGKPPIGRFLYLSVLVQKIMVKQVVNGYTLT